MQNLVPQKIIQNFIDNKFTDRFDCFSMFVDISGFTSTTEALMKHGQEGAEILSDILKYLFNTTVNAVYDRGGYVTKYAGDAFTAIFEIKDNKKTTALRVLEAAKITNKFFDDNKIYNSKFGEFDFGVKVGLAFGECKCGIVGSEDEKTYYFSGSAVDLCAMAEHNADKGDIWAHSSFYEYVKEEISEIKTAELYTEKFYQAKKISHFKVSKVQYKKIKTSKEDIYHLAGKLEAKFPIGEFRDIISVFISFEGKVDLHDLMERVYELKVIYGGSHPVLDFGDKGGNILLFFGAPISYENNIQRALNFIIRLIELRSDEVKIRAGMAKGVVYCGFSGADIRQEFTCLGNTVNQSARFMMQADWDQIMLGREFTLNENFVFDHIDDIKYKGIENLIPTYNLTGKAEVKDIFFKGDFVGRNKEKERLKKLLSPLENNKNFGVVYLDGEAGIGKSRLSNKVRSELLTDYKKNKNSLLWFYFACDEIIRSPYNPLHYYFNRFFDLMEDDVNGRNSRRFTEQFLRIISNVENSKLKRDLTLGKDYIAYFLDLEIGNSDILIEDPNERQNNIYIALVNFFKAFSEKSRIVFEVDNASFIDTESIKLFKRLAEELRKEAFGIIFNCRFKDNGEKYDLGFSKQKRILLKNLSNDDFVELTKKRFNSKKLPGQTISLLKRKSHKNPLFLEQMIYYIEENNLLDNDNKITRSNEIPDGLNQIVIARIDKLRQQLKEILKTASVLGNDFSVEVISHILSDKYDNVGKYLTELEDEDILILVSEVNYLFKYAVIRDSIYDMQLKKIIRELHEMSAEAIEDINSAKLEPHFNTLAYHYDLAENPDKAMEYLKKAGLKAKNDYQNEHALKHFNRWVHYASLQAEINEDQWKNIDVNKHSQIVNDFIQINFERFYFYFSYLQNLDLSELIIDTSYFLADKINDESLKAQINIDKSQLFAYKGNFDDSNKCLESALVFLKNSELYNKVALVYESLGKNYLTSGKMDKALEYFNLGLDSTKLIQNSYLQNRINSKLYGNIGIVYDYTGQFDKALENYQKQLEITEKMNFKLETASAIGNIGIVYHLKGELDKARIYYERKLILSEELGKKNELAQSLNNIGFLYKDLGEYKKAISHHKKSFKLSKELSDYATMSGASINLGHVYKVLKDYVKAEAEFKRGMEIAEKYGIKHLMAEALIEIGELYIETGEKSKAKASIDKGLVISNEIGYAEYIEKGNLVKKKLK